MENNGTGQSPSGLWPSVLITGYAHFLGREVSQISKAEEQKVKRMNLNVPVELHNSFKSVTAVQGQNMTDVLLEFIKTYVAKNSPKGRRK
jgi:hypothetical protein